MTKRIPLKDRVLPTYTRGEEIFNMTSHIVGGGLGVVVLALCLWISLFRGSVSGVIGGGVFGISMITLYTMSGIYHGLRTGTAKKVFQILDHCTIYFLIAGTYTPILVCAVAEGYPVEAWVTFGALWGLTALAVTLTAIDLKKYKVFSMICYVAMGWAVIFTLRQTVAALGGAGFAWVLGGGLFYTFGILFYGFGKKVKYFHSIFHLMTLFGSICHALAILFYVLW